MAKQTITINARAIASTIGAVGNALGFIKRDDLEHMYFCYREGDERALVVATDRCRLYMASTDHKKIKKADEDMIIPGNLAKWIVKQTDGKAAVVDCKITWEGKPGNGRVSCDILGTKYDTDWPDLKCPDWRKILAKHKGFKKCYCIGFNPHYMADLCKSASLYYPSLRHLKLQFVGQYGPTYCTLETPDGGMWQGLLMPMRLDNKDVDE